LQQASELLTRRLRRRLDSKQSLVRVAEGPFAGGINLALRSYTLAYHTEMTR
jgi:hypothetical protein